MSSINQAEGERWAMIRQTRGMSRASANQATKRGYRHRTTKVPRGTAVSTTQKCVPPHVKTRDRLAQARPMSGRARLNSYGFTGLRPELGKDGKPTGRMVKTRQAGVTADELTGAQRRRYRAKMNRQVNRTSGIARTLRGREVREPVQLPQLPKPEKRLDADESKSLLKRINEVWRRSR